jgi:hypothetical protein
MRVWLWLVGVAGLFVLVIYSVNLLDYVVEGGTLEGAASKATDVLGRLGIVTLFGLAVAAARVRRSRRLPPPASTMTHKVDAVSVPRRDGVGADSSPTDR